MTVPVLGLVVPPAHGRVPDDAGRIFPSGVRFVAAGLGLTDMVGPGYARALDGLGGAVDRVLAAGAQAVSLMGTSLGFYRGAAAHDALCGRLAAAADGRPTSTMALAVVRALRHVGARRLVVGSAYTGAVARALSDFLTGSGFDVLARRELGITAIDRLGSVHTGTLVALGDRLFGDAPDADALLLSCGGLQTLDAVLELERRWERPVISSSQAGFWDVVRLLDQPPPAAHPSLLFHATG